MVIPRRSKSRSRPGPAPPQRPERLPPARPRSDGVEVPYGVRAAAAWSWRLLLIVAAVAVTLWVLRQLSVVLVPVIIGLLVAAVASPAADRLHGWGLPRWLATLLVIVGGLVLVAGLVTLIAQQVSSGFDDLQRSFKDSLGQVEGWLQDVGLRREQLRELFDRLRETAGSGDQSLGGTVLRATVTAGHLVAGVFIALFATIFFVLDGRRIWSWLVGLFPEPARERVHGSGVRAWAVLTSYVRATALIALVDAVGISLVALILGLPLVLPIGVLVFLGAFIPVVGATISGAVAVAVALVTDGPVAALVMLAGVVGVQQLESHVLQPFLMGRMVRVHPLAVVLVIAVGGLTAGIFGALIAVPLAAVINTVGTYLAGERRQPVEEAGPAADPAVAESTAAGPDRPR